MQPDRPQQGIERLRPAREQSADDPRKHVAAAGHAEAGRSAVIGPALAAGLDHVARDALHQHDGPVKLGRPEAALERIVGHVLGIAVEQACELVGIGQEDR